ncbi:HsdR family type I site-specific deoxyribonuclease [Butyricimonas hominis]|uniref:type I restriction endonuclease subunit R n=1 Tax=Butyricimonas TaxID=574697 RepID=UPI0035166A7D
MSSNTDNMQFFVKEIVFEQALVDLLPHHGWEKEVLVQPYEEDLVKNWAKIIFDNNRDINKLGDAALTDSEMKQIIDQINMCDSPYAMNRLINGGQVCIKRDNTADKNNFGKEVYLKIFDAREISAGQSRYQIARQPRFKASHSLGGERRGDVMLLINGMPVIHIELKRSKVDVSQATFQIKRYVHEGIFSNGIFKMVQIFVAMTPEETLYFANPGLEENFKPEFYFHWQDFNNTVISDWRKVTSDLLSIPMAHQMIGYYTIADDKDKTLKVLRSYQYFAASKISDVTHKTNWDTHQHRGGYIWHTTGSGKTMTSFKSAQLIANSGDADKVVFLMDRIELSTQSLDEYRGFAGEDEAIQDTQNTAILVSKLKSIDNDDKLIVTSIQKMSNVNVKNGILQAEIDCIGRKRLVFIIDECHRSVFGDMLIDIKNTFPRALLFGFTGTPVFEENAKNEITTETLFGDMLHKYTIANGIPDKNVLGFDPYQVKTYDDNELREKAAFSQLGIKHIEDIEGDEQKMAIYNKFINELEMPATYNDGGEVRHGIEHYLPKDLYQQPIHHQAVAADIIKGRDRLSKNGKFHGILATKNILEAIAYYKIFKEQYPSLNVVAVFDNNIDNSDGGIVKEDALLEMLEDYNLKYQTTFQLSTYAKYKKDVAKRLAHKKPYIGIEHDHNQQIDLLIVVSQMLTGYDSKWVNVLYVDKVMKYVDIIQSFSRTNRLFGPDKPFGIIKYYSFPYTMEQNINDALEVYVDRPLGVFVDKLESNLNSINQRFLHISDIFKSHEIEDFKKLPETREDRNMFAKDFCQITHLLEAAKLQGFLWEKKDYEFQHGDTYTYVTMLLDEQTYLILLQRYRELFSGGGGSGESKEFDYPIDTYITETGTGTIDAEYINSKFVKFIKNLYTTGPGSELTKEALKEFHKTFSTLSQREQRTAMVILHDIQSGDLHLSPGKTIYDYITEYQMRELHKQIMIIAEATGVNSSQLEHIMGRDVTEQTINEFSQFDNLKLTLNMSKTRDFISKVEGTDIPARMVMPKADKILREFILDGVARERILKAYLNLEDNQELESGVDVIETSAPETSTAQPREIVETTTSIKGRIRETLSATLTDVLPYMRPIDEVIESVFYVIDAKSIDSLDNVGIFVQKAFATLYGKGATIVDKFVSFNLLVTKFEAYLKKLYYLIKDKEVAARNEGEDPTWKDVIYVHKCLWNLKYNADPAKQQLHEYLLLVKGWRNAESHISPTASEKEVDVAISIITTMYFYVTGSSITDLEMNGHDVLNSEMPSASTSKIISFEPYRYEDRYGMVAEPAEVRNLPEETRIDILKRSIKQLLGYNPKKSLFTKQRHWIAIYRVAVDMGFVIDGDYSYFKSIIDKMNIKTLSVPLPPSYLEKAIKGIYAMNIEDWTTDGFSGKELIEYEDIKSCATTFAEVLGQNIPRKETIN